MLKMKRYWLTVAPPRKIEVKQRNNTLNDSHGRTETKQELKLSQV